MHSDTDLNDLHREVTLLTTYYLLLTTYYLLLTTYYLLLTTYYLLLHREVTLLAGCSHPHLLPLLGHCLSREAACLVF